MQIEQIISYLEVNYSEKFKENIIKLGIPAENTIGVSTSELRKLAKKIPKDKKFLLELWATGYHECKILTVLALNPADCQELDIELIMGEIHSWDLCDLFCKSILIKLPNFNEYINRWIISTELYEKRAAFTLIASTSTHAEISIQEVKSYLALIEAYSDDERLLVKKAASWALRELGKINEESQVLSIEAAEKMSVSGTKAQQWIAKDALKELVTLVSVTGRSRLISSKSKMGKATLE